MEWLERGTAWIESLGLDAPWSSAAARATAIAAVLIAAILADLLVRRIILRVIHAAFERTRASWDDRIAQRGVLLRLSRIAPAIIINQSSAAIAGASEVLQVAIERATTAWIIVVAFLTLDAAIDTFHDIYREQPFSRKRPIKGFVQLAKVVLVIVAGILVVTTILDQSPIGILSGLGAMSAVLLLIFRDSILGFVSGIQLSANNLVEIGDWISMPRYDADGDVIDITLQSIKVQNWDKTITTIPIYALVSDSFRNWRGMSESGGRRIKRSVSIDMRSVRFLSDDEFERLQRFRRIQPYLEERQREIDEFNSKHRIEPGDTLTGRRMTNLGVFRAYLERYLREHPLIRQDMTFLVRQLESGPTGLPIEIYVFSSDQRWAMYEGIQADIFDHILAVLPEFGLRVFQEPSGADLTAIADALLGATRAGAPS